MTLHPPTYGSLDEALAVALKDLSFGEVLVVHEATCREALAPYECTCKPMIMRGGGSA